MDLVIPEEEAQDKQLVVPDDHDLYYVKLVGLGPNALAQEEGIASRVVDGVQGYYFLGPINVIEEQLVTIVRRCFADRRKQQND